MKTKSTQRLRWLSLEFILVAGLFMLSILVFSLIVYFAVYATQDRFDTQVQAMLAAHTSPQLITIMEKATFFGSTYFLFPAYLFVIGWQLLTKHRRYALYIAMMGISSTLLMQGLKLIFHRSRPVAPILKGVIGYSFPSGHSLSSFIFFNILIYLTWKSTMPSGLKWSLIVLLAICPLIIGLSRVILNVHYPTDVIGGYSLAIIWVLICFSVLRRFRRPMSSQDIKQ